jgi:hypothetical protein
MASKSDVDHELRNGSPRMRSLTYETHVSLLSDWDQAAPRGYFGYVLCFPAEGASFDDIYFHLREAFDNLARLIPITAGVLAIEDSSGLVRLVQNPGAQIRFNLDDRSNSFPISYEDLKSRGFPQQYFFESCLFGTSSEDCTNASTFNHGPVFFSKGVLVNGGLLLAIFAHHSAVAGEDFGMILTTLSIQTQGSSTDTHYKFSKKIDILPLNEPRGPPDFDGCSEYIFDPTLSGPQQPIIPSYGVPVSKIRRAGKIFVFDTACLEKLRREMAVAKPSKTRRSTMTIVTALFWSHISAIQTELDLELVPRCDNQEWSRVAKMFMPCNWRHRAFREEMSSYLGNSTVMLAMSQARSAVVAGASSMEHLADVVDGVAQGVAAVDEDFVARRARLFRDVKDFRHLGLDFDMRRPADLNVNTWRSFAPIGKWRLTAGGPLVVEDATRKPIFNWGLAYVHVLPAREESTKWECLVQVPEETMKALCRTEALLKWVERIVE